MKPERAELRSLAASRELVLATLAMASINMGVTGVAAITPFIRDGLGLSTTEIGLIGAVIFGVGAAVTFPGGAITDVVGAGPSLAVAQLATALGLVVAASAPNSAIFYLGIVIVGFGFGMLGPPTNVLARAGIPHRRRGLAMSVKQTGVMVGGAAGAISMALLAGASGWRVALLVPASVCLLVGIWAARVHRREKVTPEPPQASDPRRLRSLPRRAVAAYGFVMGGVQLALITYLPLYLVESRMLDPTIAGAALSVALVAGAVGRIGWGMTFDRYVSTRVAPLVFAATGSGAALILLFVVPEAGVWPLVVVLGLCGIGWNGVYHTIVTEAGTPGRVGRASAVGVFFIAAGSVVLPPPLGALVDDGSGWGLAWTAAAVITFASAAMMGLTSLRSRPVRPAVQGGA